MLRAFPAADRPVCSRSGTSRKRRGYGRIPAPLNLVLALLLPGLVPGLVLSLVLAAGWPAPALALDATFDPTSAVIVPQSSSGVPIAYDFSTRWTDEYLARVAPYVQVAILSCAHLSDADREREMRKAAAHGVQIVLGTIGEAGSYVLYDGQFYYAQAVHADDVIDTMGAGDAYFAAFLCDLLKSSRTGALVEEGSDMPARLQHAMAVGAAFSARMCAKEGAFGYGTPIVGRTEL